jgi:hypothetical protein
LGIPHSRFLSWAEDDQDKALAYLRDRATVCGGCGTRAKEWDGDPFAFVAQATTCLGCEVIERERDNVHEQAKGVRIFLVPRAMAMAGDE